MSEVEWGEKIENQVSFTFLKDDELPKDQLSLEEYQKRIGLFPVQDVQLNSNETEVFAEYTEKRDKLLGLTQDAFEAEQSVYDVYGRYAFGSVQQSGRFTKGGGYSGGLDFGGMNRTVLDSNGSHVESRRRNEGGYFFLGATERYGLSVPSQRAIKAETDLDEYIRRGRFMSEVALLDDDRDKAMLTDLVRMTHPLSTLNLISAYDGVKQQLDALDGSNEGHVFAYRFMRNERSKSDTWNRDSFSEFIVADRFEVRKIEKTSTVWKLGLIAINATSVRFDYTKHHTKQRSKIGKAIGPGDWTAKTSTEHIEVAKPQHQEEMVIGPVVGGVENLRFNETDKGLLVRSSVMDGISDPAKLSESVPAARTTSIMNVRWDQIAAPAGVTGIATDIESLPDELPDEESTAREAARKAIKAHLRTAAAV